MRTLGLLLVTMATSFYGYSQERSDSDIDSLLDEFFFNEQQFLDELIESDTSYNFLYTSVSYNSNTFFSGRNSGTNQFHIIPQISYYHSSGFNASVSGLYYEKFFPNWDFTSLSLGYFNTLGKHKNFTYNFGYTRYFYSDGFNDFNNSLDVSLGIRNNKKTIGTNLIASYIFGSDQSYQFVSTSFVSINLARKENFALRLRPNINFIAAKQNFTFARIIIFNGTPVLRRVNYEVFDLLNTQINIPISLTTNSWDFELSYSLNMPNAIANENNLPTTSLFSLSVGYLFDFD